MSNRVEALVVGAGISGLATAYGLQKAGIAIRVIEAAARPGGVIQSVKRDGYLVECGPQSFSGNGRYPPCAATSESWKSASSRIP